MDTIFVISSKQQPNLVIPCKSKVVADACKEYLDKKFFESEFVIVEVPIHTSVDELRWMND